MRFALWRRVQVLSYDDIDKEIDEHQRNAERLVGELQETLEQQNQLWRELRGKISDDRTSGSAEGS